MATKRQLADARKLLEDNGYTVLPPEQTKISTADFEDFWNAYDKKIDRDKCIRKWAKMTPDEKKACMDHVPLYVMSTPDKQFRKSPYSYLYNKSWNNEIIVKQSTEQQRQQRLNDAAELVAKYGKASG